MSEKDKEKPDFIQSPDIACYKCGGRGEVKDQYISRFFGSGNWTYKKCEKCNGTGKLYRRCIECGELLTPAYIGNFCNNRNCSRVGLLSVYFNESIYDK